MHLHVVQIILHKTFIAIFQLCSAGCAEDGDGDTDSSRSVQSSVWPDNKTPWHNWMGVMMCISVNSIWCWAVCDTCGTRECSACVVISWSMSTLLILDETSQASVVLCLWLCLALSCWVICIKLHGFNEEVQLLNYITFFNQNYWGEGGRRDF